ncbi:MAG: hypothetical protein Q8K59_02540 [Nitrosomonas sp.]|nr:hypothetical protein [Nitrosomonas sp.]MDP1949970.1 hypothetical protein [Nitrosomonas sp.]
MQTFSRTGEDRLRFLATLKQVITQPNGIYPVLNISGDTLRRQEELSGAVGNVFFIGLIRYLITLIGRILFFRTL